MRYIARKLVFAAAFAAFAAGLAGCETVKGLGKDITNAGEATERAIDNAK